MIKISMILTDLKIFFLYNVVYNYFSSIVFWRKLRRRFFVFRDMPVWFVSLFILIESKKEYGNSDVSHIVNELLQDAKEEMHLFDEKNAHIDTLEI